MHETDFVFLIHVLNRLLLNCIVLHTLFDVKGMTKCKQKFRLLIWYQIMLNTSWYVPKAEYLPYATYWCDENEFASLFSMLYFFIFWYFAFLTWEYYTLHTSFTALECCLGCQDRCTLFDPGCRHDCYRNSKVL